MNEATMILNTRVRLRVFDRATNPPVPPLVALLAVLHDRDLKPMTPPHTLPVDGAVADLGRLDLVVAEASRFSERMQNHFLYGTDERLPDHIVALGDRA